MEEETEYIVVNALYKALSTEKQRFREYFKVFLRIKKEFARICRIINFT